MDPQVSARSTRHTDITTIHIVGPSSTGKTTLCKALAAVLGLPQEVCISEVARTVMRERNFTRNDVGKLEMQRAIMEAQLEEARLARRYAVEAEQVCRRIVLSDR